MVVLLNAQRFISDKYTHKIHVTHTVCEYALATSGGRSSEALNAFSCRGIPLIVLGGGGEGALKVISKSSFIFIPAAGSVSRLDIFSRPVPMLGFARCAAGRLKRPIDVRLTEFVNILLEIQTLRRVSNTYSAKLQATTIVKWYKWGNNRSVETCT